MKVFIYTDNDTYVSFEDVYLSKCYRDIKHFRKENPDLKPLVSYNVKDVIGFDIEKLQTELREKDLEIEEMKDRLKYEVKMIEGAANDEIHLLNHNIERLINMNKIMREALEFVKDTLDEEKINLGMIKAIDACVFHALEKVDQSTQICS